MASDLEIVVERVLMRMDFQDQVLAEIRADGKETKAQATQTNGRVTALEKIQARTEGARDALSWRTPLIVGVVCTVVGAAVSHFV